jgi:hypothetical protein
MRRLSRRTVLKGLGTALALPWLEAMSSSVSAAPAATGLPKRMAFLYVPNGVRMEEWTPLKTGRQVTLPGLLDTLKEFRQDFSILTGLTCDKARPNGDGPGDHARAMASFLTGRQARKTHGADIKAGISVDQLAAQKLGEATRFPSLEIGAEGGRQAGNCDSGYSCAYSSNLSWRSDSTPQPKEINPKQVFERLFGNTNREEAAAARAKRERYRKSILDLVAEDAGDLKKQLGVADQRKLDEYLSGVRDVELRLTRAASQPIKEAPLPKDAVKPTGIPKDYQEHLRLLTDLLVLAFQGDVTRIVTFVYANEGSNRAYPFVGVSEGHHDLSHHGRNKTKLEKIQKINTFHLEQFAYLLKKLKSVKEGEGKTLLDSCMVVYGSGNSDGDRHNHDDLPILLAGHGGGTLHPGQHLRVRRETPLTNLYVSLLDNVGVRVSSFGDSTGRLADL